MTTIMYSYAAIGQLATVLCMVYSSMYSRLRLRSNIAYGVARLRSNNRKCSRLRTPRRVPAGQSREGP